MDYCIHCGRQVIHPEYECNSCKEKDEDLKRRLADPSLVPIMCVIPDTGGASKLKFFKRENAQ